MINCNLILNLRKEKKVELLKTAGVFVFLVLFSVLVIIFQTRETEDIFLLVATFITSILIFLIIFQFNQKIFPTNRKIKLYQALLESTIAEQSEGVFIKVTGEETYEGVSLATFSISQNGKSRRMFCDQNFVKDLKPESKYIFTTVHSVVIEYEEIDHE